MSGVKLTTAQMNKLATIPEDWTLAPFHSDTRPIAPLLRLALSTKTTTHEGNDE